MCNAFSCLLTRDGKVLWAAGVDSHTDLIEKFHLDDTKPPFEADFVRLESTPKEGYLWPEKEWNPPKVDQSETPMWFSVKMLLKAEPAREAWMKTVYSKVNLEEIRNPVNPIDIEPPKIGEEQVALVRRWDSLWDSLGASLRASLGASLRASLGASLWASLRASLWDSLRASLRASLWDSLRDSLRASLWDSLRDSLGAYLASLCPGVELKVKREDIVPAVLLWKQGLIPVKTGSKKWALYHPLRGKPAVKMWEGEI